jgi:tRNA-modifying protein YgfZ
MAEAAHGWSITRENRMDSNAYRAARERAAILDEPDRARIVLAGADRRTYLHGLLTNDIEGLGAGRGCYAAYLTPQGRMISDMYVLELGDAVLLDAPESRRAELLQKFDQFIFSEDVQLGDATGSFVQLTLAGPLAADVLSRVWQGDPSAPDAAALSGFAEHQNVRVAFSEDRIIVARRDEDYGLPAFTLYVPTGIAEGFVEALRHAGATRADRGVADVLRIEAGHPVYGVDMDSDTIPLEAGIENRAISFTKGCYVGQEVIIRVLHRGHGRVARKLVGLRVDGAVPPHGAAISHDGRPIGTVTSAVHSPILDAPIALGYVHRDFADPGTRVAIGDGAVAATVSALPFTANG